MKKLLLLAPLLALSACAVVKVPEISSINQDAGKIAVAYDYGLFQKPEVNWGNTLATASAQCKAWHYQDAVQSVAPQTDCVQNDQNGRCNSWKVQALYDCKFSPEQAKAYNDKLKAKKDAEILAQQEAQRSKIVFISSLSDFEIILSCDGSYDRENEMKSYLYYLYRTDVGRGFDAQKVFYDQVHRARKCSMPNISISKDNALNVLENSKIIFQGNGQAYFLVKLGVDTIAVLAR